MVNQGRRFVPEKHVRKQAVRHGWKILMMKLRGLAAALIQGQIYDNPGNEPLLGRWLNFKLFGITYLVGKIKFKPLF